MNPSLEQRNHRSLSVAASSSMNRKEAKEILESQVRELKKRSYSEFLSCVLEKRIETTCVKAASGTEYQLEIEARWDNRPGGDIRVLVGVDDGRWLSSLVPVSDSFVVRTDGSLIVSGSLP